MRRVYVGLDVGSNHCHLGALGEDGDAIAYRKFPTSEETLVEEIRKIEGHVEVHLEASTLAGWVRRVLRPHVKRVYVSHPKSNAWIGRDPLKGDRIDAWKLAHLLRMGQVHEVYYSAQEDREQFKQVVKHYDDLTQQQARLKVKIKARLRERGLIVRGKSLFTTEGRQELLKQVSLPAAREVLGQLYELLDHTREAQEKGRKLMRREGNRYGEVARMQQVPGVALVGASRFSAYIQDPHRFSNKRKLWRYCRLGIAERSSDGKLLSRRRLDRNGNGRLKDVSRKSFEAAMRTKTDNQFKRAYQASLERTHDRRHARLSTQRKILTVLWTIWKEDTEYKDHKG